MLQILPNTEVKEFSSSILWFGENGIMYSKSKATKIQTLDEAKEVVEYIRNVSEGKKVCMLVDVTYAPESSREVREYAAEELPKLVKALAMVSESVLGKVLANLFFNIKSQPYPVKMFNGEKEAMEWLLKYL